MKPRTIVVSWLAILAIESITAQTDSGETFSLSGVPKTFQWVEKPASWELLENGTLRVTAKAKTDLFIDPEGAYRVVNSSKALFQADSVFQFRSKVEVGFLNDYDAGVLLVYKDPEHWAKFCFEYSPQGEPMIVSVVTDDVSDDANSVVIPGDQVYLRVSGLSNSFAFHYSMDGKKWHFVRYFSLGRSEDFRIGLSAQSPMGDSCQVEFSEVSYSTDKLADLRNGE